MAESGKVKREIGSGKVKLSEFISDINKAVEIKIPLQSKGYVLISAEITQENAKTPNNNTNKLQEL